VGAVYRRVHGDLEVRLPVLADRNLGSGLGEFGARPFIWGTLYSSVLALVIAAPIALGIAIYISELSPSWLSGPWCS
jgi:ABC-type phosphate transport system permease subunit